MSDEEDDCPELVPITDNILNNEEAQKTNYRVPVTIVTGFLGINCL